MASASYQALTATRRTTARRGGPNPGPRSRRWVEQFARARTKTEKRDWSVGQGINETGFLAPHDAARRPRPGPLEFMGRMLPPLKGATSNQHDAAPEIKAFFDELFARWLGTEPVDAVVMALGMGAARPTGPRASGARASQPGATRASTPGFGN